MKGDFYVIANKTVFGCFTAVLWKAWALTDSLMSGFWVTGPQVKDLLNHEKCHSAVLRVSESSGGFCFLLSFIPRPRLLQKSFWDYTQLLCPAGSGETRHGHRYLLLLQALLCSCLQPWAKDLQILRVLLIQILNTQGFIGFFVMRLFRS